MAGVSEAIQIDQPLDLGPPDDVVNQIRANETRAACDEKIHIPACAALRRGSDLQSRRSEAKTEGEGESFSDFLEGQGLETGYASCTNPKWPIAVSSPRGRG